MEIKKKKISLTLFFFFFPLHRLYLVSRNMSDLTNNTSFQISSSKPLRQSAWQDKRVRFNTCYSNESMGDALVQENYWSSPKENLSGSSMGQGYPLAINGSNSRVTNLVKLSSAAQVSEAEVDIIQGNNRTKVVNPSDRVDGSEKGYSSRYMAYINSINPDWNESNYGAIREKMCRIPAERLLYLTRRASSNFEICVDSITIKNPSPDYFLSKHRMMNPYVPDDLLIEPIRSARSLRKFLEKNPDILDMYEASFYITTISYRVQEVLRKLSNDDRIKSSNNIGQIFSLLKHPHHADLELFIHTTLEGYIKNTSKAGTGMEIYERIASGFSFYADKGRYLDAVNRNGKFLQWYSQVRGRKLREKLIAKVLAKYYEPFLKTNSVDINLIMSELFKLPEFQITFYERSIIFKPSKNVPSNKKRQIEESPDQVNKKPKVNKKKKKKFNKVNKDLNSQ